MRAAYLGAFRFVFVPVLSAGGPLLCMLITDPVSGLHLHNKVLILSQLLNPGFIHAGDVAPVKFICGATAPIC